MQRIRQGIIYNIIPCSVGVNENALSFTPPSLRNYSKCAAQIWRKDLKLVATWAFGNSKFQR